MLIALPRGSYYPSVPRMADVPSITSTTNASLLDATRTKHAWIFQIPGDGAGTLDKVEVFCGSVTAPSNIKFSFQQVVSGLPNDSPDQYRVLASPTATWLAPGLITNNGTDGGSKRDVVAGEWLAVVIEWESTQSGNVQFHSLGNAGADQLTNSCYAASHNGSIWTKYLSSLLPGIALKYSDGRYLTPTGSVWPLTAVTARTYNTGSTPDERALYFQLPAPFVCDGCWLWMDLDNACEVVLYDSNGSTVLNGPVVLTSNLRAGSAAGPHFWSWPAVILKARTNYRLTLKPTSGSSVVLYEHSVNSAAIMVALEGGAEFHLSTRADAGSWSQTTTERVFGGLHLAQVPTGIMPASSLGV